MHLELWVLCAKCGATHGPEDFAQQDPKKARALAVQELPKAADENNLDTIWIPRCRECGNDSFYVQLDPEDMVEVWENLSQSDFALPEAPDRDEGLRIWQERAAQQEEEFRRWRAARPKKG